MKIKTYVINMEAAAVRRTYMTSLLSPIEILDVEYVKAIDGRKLTEDEREKLFDYSKSVRLIGRRPNGGEVGCALSHRMCYEALIASGSDYAIVFEAA